jgi:hypothetical protein
MSHTIHRPPLTAVATARRAGVATLAALIFMTAAGAPAAPAMPADGYHSEFEGSDAFESSDPIQAPKPGTPSVYCISACVNAFDASASNATTSTIGLSWSGASGYTGYVVERRKTDLGGGFDVVARLGAAARDYTDAGLTDNTNYDYRVTATGDNGSASSKLATARTLPAPTTLSASNPTTRTVDLRWSATTGASGYAVERRETSSTGSFATVANLDSAVGQYTDRGLSHSTDYEYRVRATGVPGLGPSNIVRVRTRPAQVERVQLDTDWTEQYRFRASSALVFAPAGAKILGVRNVSVVPGEESDIGLPAVEVEHRSSDMETRRVEELGFNATTSAFNGQLAKGSWSLRVAPASALFLWECTGHIWNATACNTVAQVVLEVTWA